MKVLHHPRISIDPTVCHGKPVVAGTRVLVGNILGSLASRQTNEQILVDYAISADDIAACLEFASSLAQFETLAETPG